MIDYSLNPLNVTINQVSLGNKKLTKSIFNQIEFRDCFNEGMGFAGDAIIGYAKGKDQRYLLWVTDGKLRRTGLGRYYDLKSVIGSASLERREWFLVKARLKYSMADGYQDQLSEGVEEPEKYIELVNKVKDFLKTIIDKQIYL